MVLTKSWWQSVVSRFWDSSPYSRWDVRQHAESDGRLDPPVPGWNDSTGPWYVGMMKEHFDNISRGILAKFHEDDTAHQLRISELESEQKAAGDALKRAENAHADACTFFKQHNPDIPVESVRKRVTGYAILTAFLFLLEFPMNFTAFKLFGDNANLLTGATAAAIGGSLLVLAHYLGIAWQKGPAKDRRALVDVVVTVTLAVLAIFSVAELRTAYLVHNPDTAVRDSATLMRSFAVFNLMLFGCAAFISRNRHMTGIDVVDSAVRTLKAARRHAEAITKALDVENKSREVLRLKAETEVHRVTDQHQEMHKLYLMYNTRVRNDRGNHQGPLAPPYLAKEGVNTSTLVSIPKYFTMRSIPVSPPASRAPASTAASAAPPMEQPDGEVRPGGEHPEPEHVAAAGGAEQ